MKIYGLVGIIFLVFGNLALFFDTFGLKNFYFPIVWAGFILTLDYVVFLAKGRSIIVNDYRKIIAMFILSAPFWKIYEYINLRLQNWHYTGTEFFGVYGDLYAFISFATVIPAFFVTLSLFSKKYEIMPQNRVSKKYTSISIIAGILLFVLMMLYPLYFFPFVWIFLFLILDSINYYNKRPSVLYFIRSKKWKLIGAFIASSLFMGFFWEFWNYFASVRWTYSVPFVDFLHIFEMPILGYLGYVPFGFTVFAFYYFIEYLFVHKGKT